MTTRRRTGPPFSNEHQGGIARELAATKAENERLREAADLPQPAADGDPPVIWLEPRPGDAENGRQWCQHDVWSCDPDYAADGPPTRYYRADIVEAAIRGAPRLDANGRVAAVSDVLSGLRNRLGI